MARRCLSRLRPGYAAAQRRVRQSRPPLPALKFEEHVIGWGIPMPESQGESSIKATLRTQAAVAPSYFAGSGRARIFYFVHGPVPASRYG